MEPVFLIGSHQIKAANQKKCCRLWIGKNEMCLLWSCTASTCGCGNPREQHTPGKASPAATPAPPLPPARAPLGPAPSRQHPGRAGGGAERPQRTGLRSGPEAPEGNGQSRRGRAQPLPPPAGGRDAPTHLRTRRFRLPPPEPRPPCSTCLEATSSRDLRRVARQPHAFPDGAAEAMAAGPGLSRGRRQQLARKWGSPAGTGGRAAPHGLYTAPAGSRGAPRPRVQDDSSPNPPPAPQLQPPRPSEPPGENGPEAAAAQHRHSCRQRTGCRAGPCCGEQGSAHCPLGTGGDGVWSPAQGKQICSCI